MPSYSTLREQLKDQLSPCMNRYMYLATYFIMFSHEIPLSLSSQNNYFNNQDASEMDNEVISNICQ